MSLTGFSISSAVKYVLGRGRQQRLPCPTPSALGRLDLSCQQRLIRRYRVQQRLFKAPFPLCQRV